MTGGRITRRAEGSRAGLRALINGAFHAGKGARYMRGGYRVCGGLRYKAGGGVKRRGPEGVLFRFPAGKSPCGFMSGRRAASIDGCPLTSRLCDCKEKRNGAGEARRHPRAAARV
jgi:hypothetical protein